MNRPRVKAASGLLYGWLLIALFIEYARPANQLVWLDFPYFYSIVPGTLFIASMFAPGLMPLRAIFDDKLAKWPIVLFCLVLTSALIAGLSGPSLGVATTVLGYVMLFMVITRIVTTEERIRGVIVTLALAHLYLLAVNPQVLSNPEMRQYLAGGTFLGDGNDFALSLCVLFPCVVNIALASRSRISKAIAWGIAGTFVLAIIASQSRGGSLGLAAVLFYLWVRSSNKLVSLVAVCLVGVIVSMYAPPEYFGRMTKIERLGQLDGSAQGRIDAWKGSIGMGANNPVLGIGAGQFGAMWGKTAHSTYFLALGELGLPGLFCVLVIVFGNMKANARLRRGVLAKGVPRPDSDASKTIRMLDYMNAGVVGFAVAGAFLSATYYPHMFILTGLLVAARVLISNSERAGGVLRRNCVNGGVARRARSSRQSVTARG